MENIRIQNRWTDNPNVLFKHMHKAKKYIIYQIGPFIDLSIKFFTFKHYVVQNYP